MFYGANSASVRDPFGHAWALLSWKEDLEPKRTRDGLAAIGARPDERTFRILAPCVLCARDLGRDTIAAAWGVGIDTIRLTGELPDGLTRGTRFQEGVIKIIAYSSVSSAVPFALILWGLRMNGRTETDLKH